MRNGIRTIEYGQLAAIYREDAATHTVELLLVPATLVDLPLRSDCAAEPLVQFKVRGDDSPAYFSQGRTMRSGAAVYAMRLLAQQVTKTTSGVTITTTLADSLGRECAHTLTLHETYAEIATTFTNHTGAPLVLEMISSFALGSLSPFATGLAPETLQLHRLRSTWSAEGRLVSEPVEALQLEPSWKQYSANALRFGSIGSFPARGYLPFVALEDTAQGVTWAASTTHASSWQLEAVRRDFGLSLSGGIANYELGHWAQALQNGETFAAPPAVVTAVCGNVDAAAQALIQRVQNALVLPLQERAMPIVFNEFCTTWGKPTEQTVLAQIELLRGKGIGVYVLDAGWYDDCGFEDATRLGKWEVSEKAFPHGMAHIVQAIHAAGMQAGIWFEFEVVGRDEPELFAKTEWLLHRDGVPITSGNRRFLDMRLSAVQTYLAEKVIGFLRKNQFDYVKVDYNETIGIGCDSPDGSACGSGLYQHVLASQRFFARLRAALPSLTLEICASGGHRLCHSFLQLGCMASFSDAHECDEIPIIAANMHRILPPRQSQIWAVLQPRHSIAKLYYQICSSLFGRLCFSGDIFGLTGQQWGVVQQGIAFYRLAAAVIASGTTTYCSPPVLSYRHPIGWQGIVRKADTQALVVVHTFHNAPAQISLDVTGHVSAVFARDGIDVAVQNGILHAKNLAAFDGFAVLLNNN